MDEQNELQEQVQEQDTMTTTSQEQVQEQETTTTAVLESTSEVTTEFQPLPTNEENIIHELFAELGVNLDYTPRNASQAFTMGLQFIAALWFIAWFVKYIFTLLRGFLKGGQL